MIIVQRSTARLALSRKVIWLNPSILFNSQLCRVTSRLRWFALLLEMNLLWVWNIKLYQFTKIRRKKRQEVYALLKDQEIRNSKLMMPKPVFWIIKDNILIFLPCILYQVAWRVYERRYSWRHWSVSQMTTAMFGQRKLLNVDKHVFLILFYITFSAAIYFNRLVFSWNLLCFGWKYFTLKICLKVSEP